MQQEGTSLRLRAWVGQKSSAVTGFFPQTYWHARRGRHTLIYSHSLICVTFDSCSFLQSQRFCFSESHKMFLLSPNRNIPLSTPLTCHRGGRAVEGGQGAGWLGSAGFQLVQAGRLLVQEVQSLFGLSELVSGRAEQGLDLAEWPFGLAEGLSGWAGCLLGWAGLQGWAGSGGCVSGSWGSASLSWAQNGNLWGQKVRQKFNWVKNVKL